MNLGKLFWETKVFCLVPALNTDLSRDLILASYEKHISISIWSKSKDGSHMATRYVLLPMSCAHHEAFWIKKVQKLLGISAFLDIFFLALWAILSFRASACLILKNHQNWLKKFSIKSPTKFIIYFAIFGPKWSKIYYACTVHNLHNFILDDSKQKPQ